MQQNPCVLTNPTESQEQSKMVILDAEYFQKLFKEGSMSWLYVKFMEQTKNKQANLSSAQA